MRRGAEIGWRRLLALLQGVHDGLEQAGWRLHRVALRKRQLQAGLAGGFVTIDHSADYRWSAGRFARIGLPERLPKVL